MTKIPLSFYQQKDVVALSRSLIGKYLFTCVEPENVVTGGMIIEKETLSCDLTKGPGTVCQALDINRAHNGLILDREKIWLEDRGIIIPEDRIQASPRIGVEYAKEDALKPLRFTLN